MLKRIFTATIFVLLLLLGLISLANPFFGKNVTKFAELTNNDPFLYDTYMDNDRLEKTVAELKKIDDEILAENQKAGERVSEKSPYPPGWRIWPDEFLSALPEIHDHTKDFLTSPNFQSAKRLLASYRKGINAYKQAIHGHILALKTVLEEDQKLAGRKVLFLGSATTPGIVYEDFLLIEKNADELEKELIRREKCLNTGNCGNNKQANPESAKKAVTLPFNPLSDDILGIDRSLNKVFGPYYVTTGCFGRTTDGSLYKHPFYVIEKIIKNKTSVKPMITNTKYYRDYHDISKRSNEDLLIKKGIVIRPHPETNDYMCTDFRYYPELIAQYLKEKGLTKGDDGNNLASLPYILDNALNFNTYLLYNIKYSKRPYAPYYLLVARTAYSVYFGTFSKAIWRIPEAPLFLIHEDFSADLPKSMYMKYEDLLSKGMTEEEIIALNSLPHINEVFREYFEGVNN